MFTRVEARTAMKSELQDDANFLMPDEVETHLSRALRQVNLDKPLLLIDDIPGDGTSDLALPAAFIKAFSVLKKVELLPDGEAQIPHIYLARDDDWFYYEDPSKPAGETLRVQFRLTRPRVGDSVRLEFTTQYTVSEDASNLDPYGFEAWIAGALKYAYTALASRYSQSNNPTIAADVVDFGSRVQSFLFLRDKAEKEYRERVGTNKGVKAAQYMEDVDVAWAHGEDFVWHPRILR